MSIIDKISIGINNKRSGNNLPFDNSTSANIGVIQPTMCREMAPDETLHVQVNSLVRLLALQNPTFGRMSLRHYHCFVPYNKLWRPFDAMLANQPYSVVNSDGEREEVYYSSVPTMSHAFISLLVAQYSDISVAFQEYPTELIHPGAVLHYFAEDGSVSAPTDPNLFAQWLNSDVFDSPEAEPLHEFALEDSVYTRSKNSGLDFSQAGVYNFGTMYYATRLPFSTTASYVYPNSSLGNVRYYPSENSVITQENADFIYKSDKFVYYFKYKPILKKLRQIFIGLGYDFSPALNENITFSPFKLMAYYAACFELFHPKRDVNFQRTDLFHIMNFCDRNVNFVPVSVNNTTAESYVKAFSNFIFDDLPEMTYYLPMDYFSAAISSLQNSQHYLDLESYTDGNLRYSSGNIMTATASSGTPVSAGDSDNPLMVKLALTLMRFVNKNTVIGRSIADYLRVNFGITEVLDEQRSPVVRIGSSRVNLNITDVMSMADTADGDKGSALGSFAGKGIGYGESETFDFKAQTHGVWLTLTVIVPESGFYQGYLRENRHINRNDFFTKPYDALGYQVIERGELMADYTAKSRVSGEFNPTSDLDLTRGWGFIPRYSEMKVGRNIVNGDLSLRSTRNGMASFTLERRLPTENIDFKVVDGDSTIYHYNGVNRPAFVPTTVYDGFRAIDQTDVVGDYNRIFTYMGSDFDHFIIHNVFKVRAVAPWKPLSSSFDTFDDEDNAHVKVNKA